MSVKSRWVLLACLAASPLFAANDDNAVLAPDKFVATTTGMTPSGVTLRFVVREWSDDASRAAVVEAMANEEDAQKALAALPTIGHVWQSGSAVGYAVKYAHRIPAPQGERVTFVTDRRLGSYEFKPWSAPTPAADVPYSVIELYLDANGSGAGTFSLAAEIDVDASGGLVTLGADAPRVLTDAKEEPKPDWANE